MPRSRYIGFATVILLVALRLSVGWHFYSEGVKHLTERGWSSEGFLRQAKGPLAPVFQSYLPDFHGLREVMTPVASVGVGDVAAANPKDRKPADPLKAADPSKDKSKPGAQLEVAVESGVDKAGPAGALEAAKNAGEEGSSSDDRSKAARKAADAWVTAVATAWDVYGDQFSATYNLNDEGKAAVKKLTARRQLQLNDWWADSKEDVDNYIHDRLRLEGKKGDPAAGDVPYQRNRIAAAQGELNARARSWVAEVQSIEGKLKRDLQGVLDGKTGAKPLPAQGHMLETVDLVMKYGIAAIGACLILGLFTRLSCLAGAMFLVSVVLTQPFWITEAAPTFNQYVELIALLTLATTAVGRWGGLDFFIHHLLFGKRARAERASA